MRPEGHIDFLNQCWGKNTGLGIGESCGRAGLLANQTQQLPEVVEHWLSFLASCHPREKGSPL